MGYYVRVLSTSSDGVPLSVVQSALSQAALSATITTDDESTTDWNQAILKHADGTEIAALERDLVADGTLGYNELAELTAEVAGSQPSSASRWLIQYFAQVRCIYALQVLSGVDQANGWEILDAVKSALWSVAPGILQADMEGFTNEDGYHILWQFDEETAAGSYWMGVLENGAWTHFEMDLGDAEQRADFLQGRVPKGAKLAVEADENQ